MRVDHPLDHQSTKLQVLRSLTTSNTKEYVTILAAIPTCTEREDLEAAQTTANTSQTKRQNLLLGIFPASHSVCDGAWRERLVSTETVPLTVVKPGQRNLRK